jgi:anti-anti-sigma factor
MAKPTVTIRAREAFAQAYIIDLAGELTSSVEPALLSAYQQANSNGSRVVILNFKQLAYKNSSGITLLVALLARCNSAGQRLFAVELSFRNRRPASRTRPAEYAGDSPTRTELPCRTRPTHGDEAPDGQLG